MAVKYILHLLVLLFVIAVFTGCDDAPTTAPADTPAKELARRIAKEGSVTFRSWNGKRIDRDCDTDITIMPNNILYLTEYGYSVSQYKGTYSIDPNGEINAKFANYNHNWPVMLLRRDSNSLLLSPKNGSGFMMGNRGAAFVPNDKGSFWPFRSMGKEKGDPDT